MLNVCLWGGATMTALSALMIETILWRLGEVDGEYHTLKEASERSGIPIQHIALAERAAKEKAEKNEQAVTRS